MEGKGGEKSTGGEKTGMCVRGGDEEVCIEFATADPLQHITISNCIDWWLPSYCSF